MAEADDDYRCRCSFKTKQVSLQHPVSAGEVEVAKSLSGQSLLCLNPDLTVNIRTEK
jgi:hypothetical protein